MGKQSQIIMITAHADDLYLTLFRTHVNYGNCKCSGKSLASFNFRKGNGLCPMCQKIYGRQRQL